MEVSSKGNTPMPELSGAPFTEFDSTPLTPGQRRRHTAVLEMVGRGANPLFALARSLSESGAGSQFVNALPRRKGESSPTPCNVA